MRVFYAHNGFKFLTMLLLMTALIGACNTNSTPPTPTNQPTFTPLAVKTSTPRVSGTSLPITATIVTQPQATAVGPAPTLADSVDPARKSLHFILVQHARCSWNQFWCPVEQGIQDAARQMKVTVTILGPDSLDLQKTAALIDQAVAAKPDGIALTVSDPLVLHDSILRAIESGIPVIAYNTGAGPIQDNLPYLTYLGMEDYQGGYVGGYQLIKAGATAGVCINQIPEITPIQSRCKGFEAAFAEQKLKAETLNTTLDADQQQKDIQTYAQSHPEVNAYLTIGPTSAIPFYAYLKASGRQAGTQPGEILHATFDNTPEITSAIEDGTTLFAIDQQPYLEGFEAVQWLNMISRYGLKPALPVLSTGPSFVDKGTLHTSPQPDRPIRLVLVHHGLCSWDAYWCVIDQGAMDAARDMNVQLTILGPTTFDVDQVAVLINHAVATHPDALAVAIPDPIILHDPIMAAIHHGEAVVALDTGAGPVKDNLPYLTFLGQDEYQGGYLGALRLIQAGAKAGVCVNQQYGQIALTERCQGMIDAFKEKGLNADVLYIGGDPAPAVALLQKYMQVHPEVNALLTLSANDPGADTYYTYLKASGRKPGELLHGTFDLSASALARIEDGTTLFAIDAQPYVQGYSAVMVLALYLRQNIRPALPITPTGPAFVDKSNVALVKQLAGKYR